MTIHYKNIIQDAANSASPQVEEAPARLVIGKDGRILYVDKACAQALGYTIETAIGMSFTDIMQFADPDEALRTTNIFSATAPAADMLREGVQELIVGDNEDSLFVQFDRLDTADNKTYVIGEVVTSNADIIPFNKDMASQVVALLQKSQNSTQTGPSSSAMGSSADGTAEGISQSDQFMNLSHDAMIILSRDGTVQSGNENFYKLLDQDKTSSEINLLDVTHSQDRAYFRNILSTLYHDDHQEGFFAENVIDCEARLVTKALSTSWLEWRLQRREDVIYGLGRDITALKQKEAALKKQQENLREAQSIGQMGHWTWIVGTETIEFSDEIYRIFGVTSENFVPTLDNINQLLHRRDVGRLMQAFQRAIIEQNNYDMDFRIMRPDGEVRYVRCEGRCQTDSQGDVSALFGIMQDITDRTLHERDLRAAKDAAERAYAAKSQFLANMSHELRTPLNAIIGFSEMMQRQLLGPIGTERYIDYIAGIRESGEHLLDLISDILDMSKIEAGKYDLDLEEVNIAKIIKLACHMMEGRAQEAQVRLGKTIHNEERVIIADRRAVMQILLNLLSNAVKFTRAQGNIHIECLDRDGYIILKVSDNGIGIPANKIKDITRPFEQAASHYTREHEGSGLGLAITKELIELHGGSLHIESTLDVGTTVSVRLPYDAYAHQKKEKRFSNESFQ
jgi:two-component system cell cycle sensor histidine kinase PleC